MSITTVIKAWPIGRRGRKVVVETYVVDSPKPDRTARSIKNQLDAYVAGMSAAAEKSALPVDAVGERVERLPDGRSGDFSELGLLFLGGALTFLDREGKELTFKFSLDAGDVCSGCLGHDAEPTDGVAEPG